MISPEFQESERIDSTAATTIATLVEIPQTMTTLVKQVSGLRDQVQSTSRDVTELHLSLIHI